mgnify:CR=1 FL=1
MKYHCTQETDLDTLVGHEEATGFCYGPLATAMRSGEELVLVDSQALSWFMRLKLQSFLNGLFIPETGERIEASPCFRMLLH